MKIKGTAFLARKRAIHEEFGEAAWDAFLTSARHLGLPSGPILATTLIDAPAFLRFQEELTQKFYHGDIRSYWNLGRLSARWAFTDGPYRVFLAKKNAQTFTLQAKNIWNAYYDDGKAVMEMAGNAVLLTLSDLPIWHTYFELLPAGFIEQALELVTNGRVMTHTNSVDARKKTCQYKFDLPAS